MINYSSKLFSYKKLFNQLIQLDQKGKLPSRMLFTGQEGIGKTSFAMHFINYYLSKNEESKYNIDENKINLQSKSYHHINNFSHPNLYIISKNPIKKNIDVDQIREMISFLNKSSFNDRKKIIFIDGVEFLNINSSNALLKSLEESNEKNLFILTHNISQNLNDTIKSRCIIFKLNYHFSNNRNVINYYFANDLYNELNDDFKLLITSPSFLINHIEFVKSSKLNISKLNIKNVIQYIIENKSYKKNEFIKNNFQSYIEIYFNKMYLNTNKTLYYDIFLKVISENDLINKFNLDLDSFFIKFENKYLNI